MVVPFFDLPGITPAEQERVSRELVDAVDCR